MKIRLSIALGIAALALLAAPIAAQGLDSVQVHGFGSWAYGDTDGNDYLYGKDGGCYDFASFALNVIAQPVERLTIAAQAEWSEGGYDDEVELDFAFAEWRFSDAIKLRAGKVKQPFGIYTEVYELGTVRPFIDLPQSLYGPQGFVAESYNGLGISGATYFDSNWGLRYDLYGGELETTLVHPLVGMTADPTVPLAESPTSEFSFVDVIGLRVIADTPITGLSFGFSYYSGDPDPTRVVAAELEGIAGLAKDVYGAQLEYTDDSWWARAEWSRQDVADGESEAYYGELAYKITEHWQVAARYEANDIVFPVDPTVPVAHLLGPFFEHEDLAVAVNYWFSPNMVAKLEYHRVDGNRFAAPPETLARLYTGVPIDPRTDLLGFGVQFSF